MQVQICFEDQERRLLVAGLYKLIDENRRKKVSDFSDETQELFNLIYKLQGLDHLGRKPQHQER